ncbi:MAG: hypothetical protein JNJ77_09150 [Planctomycetia bacterium]|nr:hypothetical protein [Planctomycetia bacterium]
MPQAVSPALHALLHGIIDYAGMFPPAHLSCFAAIEKFQQYLQHEHAWMLRWFVINSTDMNKVSAELKSHLSVLAEDDVQGVAAVETRRILAVDKPVYCEVPLNDLAKVKETGCFAKIRTGSVKPEGIPSVEVVADFIIQCAELRLPFKATAGLHHPVRAVYPLTYAPDSPRATMHGFLNVFMAASFAWHGDRDILPILCEEDPDAFHFDLHLAWKDRTLSQSQIHEARKQFAHAFGSCSFEEPVQDLQARGWL